MSTSEVYGADDRAASDLFSLGVTLYQAVEGRLPFRRENLTATLAVATYDPPQPGRAAAPAPLIMALLAKDPDDRPTGGSLLIVDAYGLAALILTRVEGITDDGARWSALIGTGVYFAVVMAVFWAPVR